MQKPAREWGRYSHRGVTEIPLSIICRDKLSVLPLLTCGLAHAGEGS
jgi:hypothetical protein